MVTNWCRRHARCEPCTNAMEAQRPDWTSDCYCSHCGNNPDPPRIEQPAVIAEDVNLSDTAILVTNRVLRVHNEHFGQVRTVGRQELIQVERERHATFQDGYVFTMDAVLHVLTEVHGYTALTFQYPFMIPGPVFAVLIRYRSGHFAALLRDDNPMTWQYYGEHNMQVHGLPQTLMFLRNLQVYPGGHPETQMYLLIPETVCATPICGNQAVHVCPSGLHVLCEHCSNLGGCAICDL